MTCVVCPHMPPTSAPGWSLKGPEDTNRDCVILPAAFVPKGHWERVQGLPMKSVSGLRFFVTDMGTAEHCKS